MKEKRNPAVYRLLYLAIFLGDALFSPFYSLFYQSVGFGEEQGILLACVPFSLFLGDWIFSYFTTSFKRSLRMMRILSFLEVLSVVAFGFCRNFPAILTMTIVASFFNSAYFQIQDGTCVVAVKRVGKRYSSVRIYGSIAYVAALLAGYFFVGKIPYEILFVISACFFLIGFFLTFFIVPVDDETPAERGVAAPANEKKQTLFGNRNFVLYLLFNTLFFGATNTLGYLLTPYLTQQLGLSDNAYSLWYGIRVVAEVTCLLLFPLMFRGLKYHKRSILIGSLGFLISSFLCVFVTDRTALVSSVFLVRGFANGFLLVSTVVFVHHLVGDKLVTRALVISAGLSNAFTGIWNLVGDTIAKDVSYPFLFVVLTVIQVIGFLFLTFIKDPVKTAQLEMN